MRQKKITTLPSSYYSWQRGTEASLRRGEWAQGVFREASRLINHDQIPSMIRKPGWLTWIDPPATIEDVKGVDGWARTNRDDIAIQVKSSLLGAEDHLRHYPKWNGVILVLHEHLGWTTSEVAVHMVHRLKDHWERLPVADSPTR